MNRTSLLTATVAFLCVFALGTSAATLHSTLGTDPDDVIDLDWQQLPLSSDQAEDLKNEIERNKQSDQGPREQAPASRGGDNQGAGGDRSGSMIMSEEQQSGDGGGKSGLAPGQEDLVQQVLDWLRQHLVLLLALLAAIAGFVLIYGYRDRLKALLLGLIAAIVASLPTGEAVDSAPSRARAEFDPVDEVDRAWLRFVRTLPVEGPRNRTPKEFAAVAKSNGMAADAVDRLTRTFEEVRYGGKPVNDERSRRVRDGLEELGLRGRSV